jgi:hypothetical protein
LRQPPYVDANRHVAGKNSVDTAVSRVVKALDYDFECDGRAYQSNHIDAATLSDQ